MTSKQGQQGLALAITSLALGIIGILSSVILIGGVFSLAGIIIAIVHLACRFPQKGLSISGLVLSLIGFLVSVGLFVLFAGVFLKGFEAGLSGDNTAFPAWNGKPVPDTTLTTIDGEQLRLSDFKGKRVLLDFWATWCPPCKRTIPHLVELRRTVSADDLVIIGISSESPGSIAAFGQRMKINYPLVSVARDAGLPQPFSDISSIPTFFIIDANGVIENSTRGSISFEQLKRFALGASAEKYN